MFHSSSLGQQFSPVLSLLQQNPEIRPSALAPTKTGAKNTPPSPTDWCSSSLPLLRAVFFPAYLGWLTRFNITPYSFWNTRTALRVLPLGITYTVMLYSSNWGLSVRLPPLPLPCPALPCPTLSCTCNI